MNTRNKRSSAVLHGLPWRGMYPAPDGTIDADDRQHIALIYAGILAATVAPTSFVFVEGGYIIIADARNTQVVAAPRNTTVEADERNTEIVADARNTIIVADPRITTVIG